MKLLTLVLALLIEFGTSRVNPHKGRRLYSPKLNYNWDNRTNRTIKRVLADGTTEVAEDLLVPEDVDGVVSAYNDPAIGVYIHFLNNETGGVDIWARLVKGNYICGGGRLNHPYRFSSQPIYEWEKELDGIGVLIVA